MSALKWTAIGIGGFVMLIGAIAAAVFMLTAGAASATDEFFAEVRQGRTEEAYRSTSPQFQQETSLDAFRAIVQRFRLEKFESVSWNAREIADGQTKVGGTIKTRDGGSVNATVILVKADGTWKVHAFHLKADGAM